MTTDTASSPVPETLAPAAAFVRLATEGVFDQPAWLLPTRHAAMAKFGSQGFPTLRDEDWRFTNLAGLAALPFHPVVQPPRHGLKPADLERFHIPNLDGHRLVFVDGHFAEELSLVRPEAGITVASLARRLAEGDVPARQALTRVAERAQDPLIALNTAFFQDGAWVHVEPGVAASPVHLLHINTASRDGQTAHTRHLISGSRGSHGVIVETHVSIGTHAAVTNTVSHVFVDDHAELEHVKIQDESHQSHHFAAVDVDVGRAGQHRYHSLALGARLSRTTIVTALQGEQAESELSGLYIIGGEQLADHHMTVEHAKPHGTSHEYFNGILAGKARAVFHGRIRVHPGAQKTDAKQTNKNLLLSDDAMVHTKPQLEIYADDVKCTHGATLGQLSDDSLFYLRSRGVGLQQARLILTQAFAAEIVARIHCAPLREHLDQRVWTHLEQTAHSTLHG